MANEIESPGLDELRRELQAVGMVVVPFGDEIHVRRSTLEYIKVRVDAGVLRCEPYIGTMSQGKATWALLAAEVIIIVALAMASRPVTAGQGAVVTFAGLLAFGFHALRYTLAEVSVSRIQAVWLDLRSRHRVEAAASPASPSLAEGPAPAQEQSKAEYVRARP